MAAPLAFSAYGEAPTQDQTLTEGAFKPSWKSLGAVRVLAGKHSVT